MSITFYDEGEAIEYKKEKAEEGEKVRITKVGSKYIADIVGHLSYSEYLPIQDRNEFPRDYLKVDKVDDRNYEAEYADTAKDINRKIRERLNYGVRTEVADRNGYRLVWSNNMASWWVHGQQTKKGTVMRLDANEIFVAGTKKSDIENMIKVGMLEELPLYGGSFERRKMGTPEYKGELPPMLKVVRDLDLPREQAVDDALLKKAEEN